MTRRAIGKAGWAALILLTGCATAKGLYYGPVPLTVTDDPAGKRFVLSFVNDSKEDICLGAENWPSPGGILDNNGKEVSIAAGGRQFFLQAENDYCPKCQTRVGAGQRVDAPLYYRSFGLPDALAGESKTLSIRLIGARCNMRRGPWRWQG